MKRFRFAFERILEWRDMRADMERAELQRLYDVRATLDGTRARLESEIADTRVSAGELPCGSDLHRMADYVQALRVEERSVHAKQQQCGAAIQKQTDACVSADRDHKLLAKLRERQLASWQSDLDRETEHTAAESWQAGRLRAKMTTREP